jgi:hypothetical protein
MESPIVLKLKCFAILLLTSCAAFAQPQVVLLRKEKVLLRKEVGDLIRYKLRDSDKISEAPLVASWEFGFVTTVDSVRYSEVKKIHAGGRSTFLSRFGRAMVIGGTGYFLIDQFNEGIISGNGFSLEGGVWRPAVALVLTGGVLSVSGRKWYRTEYGPFRLITAEPDSPFYRYSD